MKVIHLFILTITLVLFSVNSRAQDVWFSNPGNSPQWINPALSGDTALLAQTAQRVQWPANYPVYTSRTNVSCFLTKINSWIYGGHLYDNIDQTIVYQRFFLGYSQQLIIGKHSKLRIALESAYFTSKLNLVNSKFRDMIDPRKGFVYPTKDVTEFAKISNPDFSAGLVFQWKMISTGASVFHLTEPETAFLTGTSKLPMRYSFHASADIRIGKDTSENMLLQPYMIYTHQSSGLIQVGISFIRNKVELHASAGPKNYFFVAGAGLRLNKMRINYNFTSFLKNNIGTAHEMGFTIRILTRSI